MVRNTFLLAFLLLISAQIGFTPTTSHFDGKTWWDHVKVLADDKMEGRDTGSEGLKHAEAYVVDQLEDGRPAASRNQGLLPAGQVCVA